MGKNKHKVKSDEELMVLICQGETSAFDILYDRYAQKLLYYFIRMLSKDRSAAEDALQDLFLKVVANAKGFDPRRNLKTWLFSIAHNICKNYYRHQAVVTDYLENNAGETESHEQALSNRIAHKMDAQQFRDHLSTALDKLSPAKREAFILRYQEEYSIAEIAVIQNCAEGSVKSRIHYALRTLENELHVFKPVND